ncbi:MAG: 16S rRNA (cytosine(1402)-N(4))-methyltransferase RsmH [Candidatus Colwellbacteria bacterium]|nr:16S rRNA (cytosine(1402)-N(4))-methyltransferase RsmH [Candidatus Colwellbacteria bacterium]
MRNASSEILISDTFEADEGVHIPVMLDEVIYYMEPKPGDFMIDGTLGGGGHARELISRISPHGKFLGVDRDPDVVLRLNLSSPGVDVHIENANYSEIPEVMERLGFMKADGLLLDLGFSSIQLGEGKGFSFMKDEPLVMTYSPDDEPLSYALRRMSRNEIKDIIAVSGEKYAGKIADAIWSAERKHRIEMTGELVEVIRSAVPRNYEKGRIHPATRSFLAFRIFINKEFEHMEKALRSIPEILKPGGRAVIITFQSLEDRIVKERFRELAKEGKAEILTKKPIPATYEESERNPRSRSAKIRAIKII